MSKPNIKIDSIFKQTINGMEVKKPWQDAGGTYDEEWGVDQIVAKKLKDEWIYVQIEWHYRNPSIGWVIKGGQVYE